MFISICIPSYNRVEFLYPLLDSVYSQVGDFNQNEFEVVICEDVSPQRDQIIKAFNSYVEAKSIDNARLCLNTVNLGYDKNLRNCIESAKGKYCMILGNDDLLNVGALEKVISTLKKEPEIVLCTRAYSWFKSNPNEIIDTVKHLPSDKLFEPGLDAIRFFFRRVGVISGFVVNVDKAKQLATDKFDGHLYYQMYLAGMLVSEGKGYYFSDVITLSRDSETPDFGNAAGEKGIFVPGGYVPEGRIHMVKGLLNIAKDIEENTHIDDAYISIKKDLAHYFYPYIRDQLNLPIKNYILMVKRFMDIGFKNEMFFYVHVVVGYILKSSRYDLFIKYVRDRLGSTPKI
ncbi:glycosyltransferase family 2 protein [Shewanella avicenniae]|uniref:Glycosyltransferase family 2 protein n=1 Tax=Shewanella avicenniae TaxID=2814294 RepID=A0ABX7QP99_9GAMM|nr:glycosyltransferase [Shewanella avicenniae]QSX32685.1 glycosyltransferase family 2 protein [Shewanella avicenniae]